ncbi:MAG: hypothetical protein P4L83_18990 [Nevskia sp.]|nr:hypothetical protein [Nevskia sp.]
MISKHRIQAAAVCGLVLAFALSACGGSGGGASSTDPAQAAGGSPRTFHGSVPPDNLRLSTGAKGFVRTVDGRQVVYVVPDPAPSPSMPLMIVLDYLGGNPTFMADLIEAGKHAAAGEVLAFPAHESGSWNNGLPSNTNTKVDIDFLTDVIDDATANLPVDGSRIFMTGYSEGGFMANLFACTRPDLLAGFGMVGAEQLQPTVCETGTSLKMMSFHGTSDVYVPYNGLGEVESAPATLGIWEKINGCSGQEAATTLPTVVKDGTSVIQHQIPGCNAILYEIVNGGHDWPGAEVTPATLLDGRTSGNIDATSTQWNYFAGG